jgi:hypothetical protein
MFRNEVYLSISYPPFLQVALPAIANGGILWETLFRAKRPGLPWHSTYMDARKRLWRMYLCTLLMRIVMRPEGGHIGPSSLRYRFKPLEPSSASPDFVIQP